MRAVILTAVLAIAVASCGKSEEQKKAEQAAEDLKKAAEALGAAAAQTGQAAATQGMTEAAKAMQGVAAALGGATGANGKPVEPIAFQTLQTHLPKVAGWEMDEPEGERMTAPFPFSQIEATYRKGDARIDTKIVDTGFAQMLIAPWSMMLAAGYSQESSRGYEKATTVSGHPAIEKWNKSSKSGELDVLVGKRFMVTIEGHDVESIKAVQDFAANLNFNAIAALK